MRPIKSKAYEVVEQAFGLFLITMGILAISYLVYAANFAPCPPGTTQISGYSGGRYTNMCVSQR